VSRLAYIGKVFAGFFGANILGMSETEAVAKADGHLGNCGLCNAYFTRQIHLAFSVEQPFDGLDANGLGLAIVRLVNPVEKFAEREDDLRVFETLGIETENLPVNLIVVEI
jgi:hypothetical protein